MLKGTDICWNLKQEEKTLNPVCRIRNKQNVVNEKGWRLMHPKMMIPWFLCLFTPSGTLITGLFTIASQIQDLSWNQCWGVWRLNGALRGRTVKGPDWGRSVFQIGSSTISSAGNRHGYASYSPLLSHLVIWTQTKEAILPNKLN